MNNEKIYESVLGTTKGCYHFPELKELVLLCMDESNKIADKKVLLGSYLELKIVADNFTELRILENHYEKLGFKSDGYAQDDGNIYWAFLRINNGLIKE